MGAKTQKRPPERIYTGRQPRRPHYLAKLMERYNVSRMDIITSLEVDKSLISRWLDENKPATPSNDWAAKLGQFFGQGHDPVDIFADPDVDWMTRFLRNRTPREVERIKAMLEAAFPAKKAG